MNILPIAVVMGSIALSGVPLDLATALVASLTLGLCVDDTIHMLYCYVKGGKLKEALYVPGQAIVQSSVMFVLAGGVILLSSDLVLMRKFGVFMSLGIACALVATLWLLPALLRRFS